MRTLRWLLLPLVLAAACATNPATGRSQLILLSEQEEIDLGRQSDEQVRQEMGIYDDPALLAYVERVGRTLVRSSYRTGLPWTFTIVDEPAVNAFALPGGFIYITRGLLPFLADEAELAAVMGHEIGHVDGRHGVDAYSRQLLAGGGLALGSVFLPEIRPFEGLASLAFGLAFLKHGRDAELEADQLGVRYSAEQGWNPAGMTGLLSTLGRLDEASGSRRGVPNWALTHPPAADRISRVQQAVAEARSPTASATNRGELERHLEGLVFGDSREKGFVRGSNFLHPVMRFAIRFPEGWTVRNSNEQVTSVERADGSVGMLLRLAAGPSASVAETARATMSKAGFREVSGGLEQINGLPAYVGTYEATTDGQSVAARVAHIQLGSETFLVAGLAPINDFERVRGTFGMSIGTFRELSQQEADQLEPDRIDFHVVRDGETWESIAGMSGNVRPASLAIMNGYDPTMPPRVGDRIRVVVGG